MNKQLNTAVALIIIILMTLCCGERELKYIKEIPLSNTEFEEVTSTTYLECDSSKFLDNDGNRAYPWGFENLQGNMDLYFYNGMAIMIGTSEEDAVLLAIPNPTYKPKVIGGKQYTQVFKIKMDNVQGHGVRIIHQWFNSSDEQLWDQAVWRIL